MDTRAIGIAALALAVAAAAQDLPERRLADIPIPSDQHGGEPFELTLEDALRIGLARNLDLAADELLPQEQERSIRVEEGFFEPEFFGNVRTGRSVTPQRNRLQPEIERKFISSDLGFRQRVVTGGSFDLTYSPARLEQSQPDPTFPSTQFTSAFSVSVTQPLLRGAWSDYALRNVDTARAEYAAAQFRYQRQVQAKLLEIVRAYWELQFARQDYRVVFQSLELAREQLRITTERIRLRDLPERDRVSDEAEVARRQEELIRAENFILQREDELVRLLFDGQGDADVWDRSVRPISAFEGDFEEANGRWQDLAREALRDRPDILALRAEVRAAEVAFEVAQRDLLPQLDLVGSYGADAARDSTFSDAWADMANLDYPDWSIELQLAVPIGNSAARAARDRAALALERTRRRLRASELDVDREIREAVRALRTLSESVRASRESVRLAATVLDTARETLRVGRGTLFEVQSRNQDLLDARQRLLRNQLDHHIARADLQFARGRLRTPDDLRRAPQ